MIRTTLWFLYFWVYLIFLIPKLSRVKALNQRGETAEHDQLVFQTAQEWARSLVQFAGVTVNVKGGEKIPAQGPVLFVSNHQGNFDIPILLGYLDKPKAFVAKVELQKMPLIRTWMEHMKCVFIDRADIRQSLKVINQAAQHLKAGYTMVIFPEGTRSKRQAMGEFKPGSLKLATKAGVPIVPVIINGSYRIMEERGFIIKPARVDVTILDPIPTQGLSKEQEEALAARVRGLIEEALGKNGASKGNDILEGKVI